ncbi:MAG TPA: TAT-variant-translocated molybdopterin oxidoreductase [Bacteroidia bacterium]|nr:TAT-variant-translocated molybdopterin oxidoreductase [Bacteroidia bacterium]
MANEKKYWKGLEELNESPSFVKARDKEFTENVPIDEFLGTKGLQTNSTSRRDFLKFLGFSIAAASLAACEAPVVKTIPYVIKPEEVTPGIDNWYASTFFDGQDYCSLLVKTRDGRPIKIEGNGNSSVTRGAANARVQSSVLSLYDEARAKMPHANKKAITWEQADKEIMAKLSDVSAKGGNIRILSSTIISPSTKEVIAEFVTKYPTTKHVSWDAVSFSGMLTANKNTFGKEVIPAYSFDKAKVIVSIAADFLTNWLSPIEFSKQYAINRKVSREKMEMSRHIQFESIMSTSGANADMRVQIKPSEEGVVALNLYNAVAKQTGGGSASAPALEGDAAKAIDKVAGELLANKGKSLVVAGTNDTAVQMVVNEINKMLGNYTEVININKACYLRQGNDEEFANLVTDMKAGKVDVLITYNVNPAYNSASALGFADAYKKVACKISLADRMDETTMSADYLCPDSHYLESWNDANPYAGVYSLSQPAISPLYSKPRYEGTRAAQESFMKWAGVEGDYYSYIQNKWKKSLLPQVSDEGGDYMFIDMWNKTLQSGVLEVQMTDEKNVDSEASSGGMSLADAASKIASTPKGGVEVVLYEKTGIGNGSQANNPWLQELPDPVSKVTWDNYITMNPAEMKEKGFSLMEEDNHSASVANLTVGGTIVKLPVFPQPGQARGTVGVALGYGRTNSGKVANGLGTNVFPLVQWVNNTFQYRVAGASIASAGTTYELAATQTHHTMIGRHIVKESTLEEYKKNPRAGNEEEKIKTKDGLKSFDEVNLWDDFDKKEDVNMINNAEGLGLRWKMAVDLNSCIGCGACVVSCNAENNVPVVGKDEIMRVREMHWIRIDRYYSSDLTMEEAKAKDMTESNRMYAMMPPSADNPEVAFQPVMCMHCNHAPCETVCPVMATSHSSEGINQMVYNRCVGTKYCANNCPYKVRRFNWFNYYRDEKFTQFNPSQDDIGRMVLNPDVVVRSRGVMEKCSFCLQRIQGGKLKAKLESRTIKDGEVNPACAQSCPTNALVFGNVNDPESRVAKLVKDERNYLLLADLDTQPNVFYMTKIRNKDKAILE